MTNAVKQATLTTLASVPPMFVGLVRDLRVRWALGEAGRNYDVRLISMDDKHTPEYRRVQPFGLVPVYEDDTLALFESGAILLHIAQRCPALMPADETGRANTIAWMFAALNTVEPALVSLVEADLHAQQDWAVERRPAVESKAHSRLADLERWLEGREYLAGQFSVADILMVTVLRFVRHTGMVSQYPALHAYYERCMARPSFARALADQTAVYAPAGESVAA